MPMVTLPLIPTLVAMGAFISVVFSNRSDGVIEFVAALLFAALMYFASYGVIAVIFL
jgi:hypothetical protein